MSAGRRMAAAASNVPAGHATSPAFVTFTGRSAGGAHAGSRKPQSIASQSCTGQRAGSATVTIEGISAITLATHDMARAVDFYQRLGFRVAHATDEFTTLHGGTATLNLIAATADRTWSWWGRLILLVDDVDATYRHVQAQGLRPEFAPRDAPWGERYFHVTDPDGHEVSFARPLRTG
jgi:catechol 2,3-dioxygenase-like lactoylglutathione lyase family enzyme